MLREIPTTQDSYQEGQMISGKTINISGKEYNFDANGVCTNL